MHRSTSCLDGAALWSGVVLRQSRGARLSEYMRDEIIEIDNRLLIAPKGHCCYVT
jgi:hypothetical protein